MDSQNGPPLEYPQPSIISSQPKLLMRVVMIVLPVLVSGVFFGAGGYYLGQKSKPVVQEKIIVTATPTRSVQNIASVTATPTLANNPTEKIEQYKIPLKENWKRISITNLGFSMQVPPGWRAGYCRNKVKTEFSVMNYVAGDGLFFATDSAEYNKTDCAAPIPIIWKPIWFDTESGLKEFIAFANTNVPPRFPKKLESFTVNGINVQILHLDWCEGLREREFNNNCLPMTGGQSKHEYISIPSTSKAEGVIQDYIDFQFILPADILNTIEFK